MFKAEVIGNLGRDAEVRRGNDGNFIVFNLCHSVKYHDKEGNEITNQLWASCTRRGDGGNLLPYLKKGQKVFVRGNVSSRTYKGNDGIWHSGINISVDEIELVGSIKTDENKTNDTDEKNNTTSKEDEIPF